ncbi:mechanosensitive ion channel family protein [Helicobacter sp. 11S03491-1]|uniref:mechanosensitive ion channel family protein n=1 Tax=Helicobacter sp. 11S03491-1 TaxID=1476196 RepID=UPI000BA6A988|nr:mechanosensitive ion channel family protein [Helicobacter sp. 11S03491-1]PAF43078.1 mechanosensitive ion channel protein [Helicobacter sp. 11S03491-1]
MKKIVFIGTFILLMLGASISLKAMDNPDFTDLYVIFKQINQINQDIDTYKNNPQKITEAAVYAEQKMDLIKQLTSKILDHKEKIGIDIKANKIEQTKIRFELQTTTQTQDAYTYTLNKILLDDLSLDQDIYEMIEKLRKKIDFFSQKDDVTKTIAPYLISLNEKIKVEYSIPSNLNSNQKQQLQNKVYQYKVKLQTYIEILSYMQEYAQNILPQNAIMNLGMEWLLEKIDHYVPINTSNLGVAKVILSLLTLIVLLGCRKIVARIILKIVDFFVKFTRHNQAIQNKIRNDITAPISWLLLVWSFDISLDILYYPNLASSKIQVWFGVVYIALLVWFVISLLKGYGGAFITTLAQKSSDGFRKEVINLILKIVYFIVIIFGLLAILKHLGFNISAIIASLGIGGLAVALAVKDLLANFFASVMLLFDNSFSQGDWIVCGDVEGTVVEMGLRRTTVRTFDNALLFVPNSELANKSIRNWNRRKVGRRIKMSIGLTYGSKREQLEKCVKEIRELLLNNQNISKDTDEREHIDYQVAFKKDIISMDDYLGYKNTLFVFVDEFADSSINILLYCFSKTVAWGEFLKVKEALILEIMKIVESNGLSFAFPSRSLYVESLPHATLTPSS